MKHLRTLPFAVTAMCLTLAPLFSSIGNAEAQTMSGMSGMSGMSEPDKTSDTGTTQTQQTGPNIGSTNTILPAAPTSFVLPPGRTSRPMPGMDMLDNRLNHQFLIDQLEYVKAPGAQGLAWDVKAWIGKDINKLYFRSEGSHVGGNTEDARVEVLWSHAVSPFWDAQLGIRHDFGSGPNRQWAAFGVQGLAPYQVDIQATAYVGASGRAAFWAQAEYDFRLTQKLILTPEIETNLYTRDDPARGIGSGLSDLTTSLRLRYEISRKVAPYIGISWGRRFGRTGDMAAANGAGRVDKQLLAGVRIWF